MNDHVKNGELREKVQGIYDYIQEELYFNRPDLKIRGLRFNSALLMSLLTGLSKGKELIVGEPGLGKTTSAEYVCALLYRFPLGTIWAGEVSGHPEQTEEKIIGRPDLGKLNQGEEVVVWSHFVQLPVKIVDEINRLPETKQSMILDGVDRGNWEYLNDAIINMEYCLFATANYQDRGTNTIIAPLIDRFDVMIESRHPGANLAYLIGGKTPDGQALRNEDLEFQFQRILAERIPYFEKMGQVEELNDRFGEILERDAGIKTLSRSDREMIRAQKNELPFDLDFNAFLRLVIAELSFCHRFGQKRSDETCEEGCHFTEYYCNSVRNCISNRFPISIRNFSQALAWFLGDESVGLEHLVTVMPYTLAHRIQWKEEFVAQHEKDSRDEPLAIYLAKTAVKNMHRRYMEQGNQLKSALAAACRIAEGEEVDPIQGDHPIYWEIRKDLGKEIS
ncbi:MAG: AAA family ATPase [Deltaproteobacteria bacterium]|nr:AAA family ATPase [Deltaproteobacteria bacterium]